jgi:hypothetical protein
LVPTSTSFLYASFKPRCLVVLIACWTCMMKCLGVPHDQTGTCNSTLPGKVSLRVLSVVSMASWSSSFSGCAGLVVYYTRFPVCTLGA